MSRRDTRLDQFNKSRPEYWNHPPPRWKSCPKMGQIIEGIFVPLKTPLKDKYDSSLTTSQRYTVEDAFDECERSGKGISAWIDLTKAKRFYDEQESLSFNAHPETKYLKITCEGHEGAPSEENTRLFMTLCEQFIKNSKNPRKPVVAVHCTHGFNRTGFMICAYLVEKLDWSVDAALGAFALARPPGIYKDDYIKELYRRYDDVSNAPDAPELPLWCTEEKNGDGTVDDDGLQTSESDGACFSRDGAVSSGETLVHSKDAKFMDGVTSVDLATDLETVTRIRNRCRNYCKWKSDTFAGCQPVSMENDNKMLLASQRFDVSWKADGVRYMLFIESDNQAFFVDRNNDVFQVHGMHFPHPVKQDAWLYETLLDGEMIIDEQPDGTKRPRYLIYDIVHLMDEDVGMRDFRTRCKRINMCVVAPRETMVGRGTLDTSKEPFGFRWKNFYPVEMAEKLLAPKFSEQMSHEVDGLVFQPVSDPYIAGRCDKVLKWKPPEMCTIDFKLQVKKFMPKGMLPMTKGLLMVNGLQNPFGELKWSKAMMQYDNQIIECSYEAPTNRWIFLRVRADKTFPNHVTTANAVMKGILDPLTKRDLLWFIEKRAKRDPVDRNGQPAPVRQMSSQERSSDDKRPVPEHPAVQTAKRMRHDESGPRIY